MENFDTIDDTGLLVPDANEDSVDIYDGLDLPCSRDADTTSSSVSQLKKSMDLYEEIVTVEQQSREAMYAELTSRFEAAQNQIKELRRRLEQMEIQNTGLHTENRSLKKNISVLLQTARQEVTRKDAEIQRLTQLSEKGFHHHHHHRQARINNQWDQNSSSRNSSGNSKSRPPPPPSCSSPLPPPPPCSLPPPPPPPPCLPPPPPPPCLPPPPQPPPCLPPPLPPLPVSPPRETHPPKEPPQPHMKESNTSSGSCIKTQPSKAFSHRHSRSSSRGDCDGTDKQTEHSVSKSSSSSSSRHSDSDKHKSKYREEKWQSHKLSDSSDRRLGSGSEPNKDCYAPGKSRSHKSDRDTRQRSDSRSHKNINYQSVEGLHRSERAKVLPPDNFHSASSSDGDKSRSGERSSSRSSKEGHSRDHRRTGDGRIRNSDSRDRKKSSSNQQAECFRDSSKEREGERFSKDYQRKEDRRHEHEINRKHKSSKYEKTRSNESDQGKAFCSKDGREKTEEAFKRSSTEQNIIKEGSVEESSPNRKLCFMETLNLTLSPMKKPVLSLSGSQNDFTPVDEGVENESDDESSQPNIEDMCVIDEIDSSQLESRAENAAEQCLTQTQVKEKTRAETLVADQQPKDHFAQTTSCQPVITAENQKKVCSSQKSPETKSLKPTDEEVTKYGEDKTKLAPACQVDRCGTLEARDGVSDSSKSEHKINALQKVNPGNNPGQSEAVTKPVVIDLSVGLKHRNPKTAAQKSSSVDSVKEAAGVPPSGDNSSAEDGLNKANPGSKQISATILPQDCQQGPCPPASTSIHEKDAGYMPDAPKDTPKDADAVSSTISLELLPQEGLSLSEAIYVLTQTNEDTNDGSGITTEPSSSVGCIAVSKVSSTTEETAAQEKYRDLTVTPKKNFSPGKRHGNNFEPSSSVPLLHDEDSMMRMLSNLKRIPDAISPLRSPIRIAKRSHLHVHSKPGHVKSLQKDFTNTAVDITSKKLDVNKENKYPGSPANHDSQNLVEKVSELPSSDSDLEEGEILSESDETAAGSPAPVGKRAKLARPVRNKPKTVLQRTSEERSIASKEAEAAGVSTPSPKSRFKTVCPAATKASFSTIDEVMEIFKLVRSEIRKKYMKLHKTFPRKSFYGVMDNFQESFLEFVDGAQFSQICSQEEELRSKLKKLIVSVFSKVSNNGIVKRIFEQQAVDLKQRLWDFVQVQVEYMFRDIYATLKSLCKTTRGQAEDNRPSGNEKVSKQPTTETPPSQQKEAQPAPNKLNQIKPCTVVPYRTGLGSRGKDIRITHVEKDMDPHPAVCPNTQTVVSFLPPKNISSTPEKTNISSLVVSQNGSVLDKTDFELLTEQQASSLTFNLVRDSQMGEIFKCLLQGSDLLETSALNGDNTTWSLGTPRKDGDRLISFTTPTKFDPSSKMLSPTKFETPSKLIATWSSISPRKMLSPKSKEQIPLNPALFDESCLLEVPSKNQAMLQSSLASQRSYSILAEDLAVSLTIPSPLKSDSHLSFLQPSGMNIMSTPDSVISAHISEDALLDGEDATEQDIHLALDTDNSSCGSSSGAASEVLATPFVFKPDLLMQALVMEKSNDHFIVKIRQTATSADTTLTCNDSLNQTLTEDQQHVEDQAQESQAEAVLLKKPHNDKLSGLTESSGICLAATGADIQPNQDESSTLTKDLSPKKDEATEQKTSNVWFSQDSQKLLESPKNLPKTTPSDNGSDSRALSSDQVFGQISPATSAEDVTITAEEHTSQTHPREEVKKTQQSPSKASLSESSNSPSQSAVNSSQNQRSPALVSCDSQSKSGEMEVSDPERSPSTAKGDTNSTPDEDTRACGKGRKRKNHQEKPKAKRSRKEEQEMVSNCKKGDSESLSSPGSLSPNSLYAKNVIRKKGEVVISWTRDEDRTILIDLKAKGASRETFSALSEKLQKPSGQIAHRFYQLIKLFKKQEKMDT